MGLLQRLKRVEKAYRESLGALPPDPRIDQMLREIAGDTELALMAREYQRLLEQAVEWNPSLRRFQHDYGELIQHVDDGTLFQLGEIAGRIDARHQALFPHDAEVPAYS